MKKNEVSVKGVMTISGVSAVLEDLVKSIDAGKICVEANEVFVTLLPSDQIDFEIKAANKKGKQKIEIELSWREVLPEENMAGNFKISSEEPEIPEEPAEEPCEAETKEEVAEPAPAAVEVVEVKDRVVNAPTEAEKLEPAKEAPAAEKKPAAKKPAAKKPAAAAK